MKDTIEQKAGQKLIETLINKSWKSDDFKEKLINNPKACIENITGETIQKEFNLVFEDQTDTNTIYLNIPRKVDIDDFELTDEQLENVAGGDITLAAFAASYLIGVAIGGAVVGIAYLASR